MKWEKMLVSLDPCQERIHLNPGRQERTVDTPRPYARREHCTSQSYVRRGQWPPSRSGEDTPWSYMSGEGIPRSCVGMGENISIPKWLIELWKDSWHAYARREHCPSQSYVRRRQWPRSRSKEDSDLDPDQERIRLHPTCQERHLDPVLAWERASRSLNGLSGSEGEKRWTWQSVKKIRGKPRVQGNACPVSWLN